MDRSELQELLLSGPRGRRACYEVSVLIGLGAGGGFAETPEELMELILKSESELSTNGLDPSMPMDALYNSVLEAQYWEEPDWLDVLLSKTEFSSALRPIAAYLGDLAAIEWWTSDVDRESQVWVQRSRSARILDSSMILTRWRSETIGFELDSYAVPDGSGEMTGLWWSSPGEIGLISSTRKLDASDRPIGLDLMEDPPAPKAIDCVRLKVSPGARVYEVHEPRDWSNLVDSCPLDVQVSRGPDWRRLTGDRGPWQIPDWAAVSQAWDGVHLSVGGYLSAAGRSLLTKSGRTVLAGFNPDVTFWVNSAAVSIASDLH